MKKGILNCRSLRFRVSDFECLTDFVLLPHWMIKRDWEGEMAKHDNRRCRNNTARCRSISSDKGVGKSQWKTFIGSIGIYHLAMAALEFFRPLVVSHCLLI